MDNRIELLIAKQETYDLACKYMRGLDRLDSELLKSVFFEDAWCEYGFFNGSANDFQLDNYHSLCNWRWFDFSRYTST